MNILAISPALNSEDTIPELVARLEKTFDLEDILLVDDGSSDGTFELAKSLGINAIRLEINSGKGMALRAGFNWAIARDYDAVLSIDSDLQHPPELCGEFIREMKDTGADIVLGNRMADLTQMPKQRRFSNKTTSFFVRLWTGRDIRDSQCGFRLIKTEILRKADLRVKRYQTETELILEASRLGAKFSSVPVPTIYNGRPSNINAFAETLNYIGLMLSHPFRRRMR